MQTNKTVIEYLRKIGRTGGSKTSDAKRAACRANGNRPKTPLKNKLKKQKIFVDAV